MKSGGLLLKPPVDWFGSIGRSSSRHSAIFKSSKGNRLHIIPMKL